MTDLSNTGVIFGSAPENEGGACVEKKRARNDRQVRWSVDVEVVTGCDRMDLEVEIMEVTCVDNDPGRTPSKACRRQSPAWSVPGAVLGDLS